jgi:hypothetical protein
MTQFTQNLRRAAQFAVPVAGFTLTAPAFAREELPRGSLDIDHLDCPAPAAANALENPALRLTAEIVSNGDNAKVAKPADQPQSYAAALKDAYTRVEICENPALAALAANIAQLAER